MCQAGTRGPQPSRTRTRARPSPRNQDRLPPGQGPPLGGRGAGGAGAGGAGRAHREAEPGAYKGASAVSTLKGASRHLPLHR